MLLEYSELSLKRWQQTPSHRIDSLTNYISQDKLTGSVQNIRHKISIAFKSYRLTMHVISINISSIFSRNFEADASEFLEDLEEMCIMNLKQRYARLLEVKTCFICTGNHLHMTTFAWQLPVGKYDNFYKNFYKNKFWMKIQEIQGNLEDMFLVNFALYSDRYN